LGSKTRNVTTAIGDKQMKQPNALRLAEALYAAPETGAMPDDIQEAADELVRLHEANQVMLTALRELLVEGEFTDYPNTKQWKAVESAKAAIAKGEQQ
jgi:hypothetical protein